MGRFAGAVMRNGVAILILFTSCAAAQMVEGNIVNSVTSTGIPRVAVHLEVASGSDSEDEPYDTVTDALGHFVLAQVKAGTYVFSYYSPSFIANEAPRFPQIHVTTGGDPLKLEGRMTALPTISGRVVDGNGNGLASAVVGISGPSAKIFATTDAAGKFEQHVSPPGSYRLAVTPPAGIKPPAPEPGSDQARVWTPVYYPGVTLWEAASRIVVHPGDQIAGIEMKLLPVPAHVVRGMLLNPDGTPAPDVTVTINIDEARLSGEQKRPAHEARTSSEGAFEFPPIADGDWRIAAELERGGVTLRALQWIEMAGHNIENVNLRLAAPFSVLGRVAIEARGDVAQGDVAQGGVKKDGAIAPEPPRLIPHDGRIRRESGAASWMLQPETLARPRFRTLLFDQDDAIAADANRDGNFAFKSVYADTYRIAPPAAPAGYYLDSVRVGETDVAAAEVQLSPGTLPIRVEYKAGGGVVRGTVEKCASGAVLLIPTDANMQWFGFLHSVRCDANDRYEIGAVRPGEYYALAFGGSDSAPSLDAGVLRQARRITVKAAEVVTADLSAIFE
jgi:hypothetical protein